MTEPPEKDRPLRVCMFGTYEAGYARNVVLREGFEANGVELHECHVPVWESMRFKTTSFTGISRYVRVVAQLASAYLRLTVSYLKAPPHDVVLVGYLGHFDVYPARVLSWLRRKPLVFDAFVSLYDTSVEDRGLFDRKSLPARLLRLIDRWSCKLADVVLLDTQQHIDYFCREFRLRSEKFRCVLVGAETRFAKAVTPHPRPDRFTVLHYSKFAPLHGVPYVLDAANLLRNESNIVFRIVGGGQTYEESQAHARRLGLQNIESVDWLETDELIQAIHDSDICLGIFGDTEKASRVLPNKVYQCLAAGAAVITGRSPASEELLLDRQDVLLCEMGSGASLAEAILELRRDPSLRERIKGRGAEQFRERFAPEAIVRRQLVPSLSALVRRGAR